MAFGIAPAWRHRFLLMRLAWAIYHLLYGGRRVSKNHEQGFEQRTLKAREK